MQYPYLILSRLGAPKPTGTPFALTSITAPQDEPTFLIDNRYFSQSFNIFLSGQKNEFLPINLSSQLLGLIPKIPICVTAPITLYFFPIFIF